MSVADRLTRKVGPLPVWGWAFLIVGGYLAYRKLSGGGQGSAADQTAYSGTLGTNDNAGASSGGLGGGGMTGGGGTSDGGTQALLDLLGQQTSAIQGLGDQLANVWSQPPPWYTPYDPYASGGGGGGGGSSDPYDPGNTNTPPPAGGGGSGSPDAARTVKWAGTTTKASTTDFARTAQDKTNVLRAAGKTPAYGGVVSVKKLKNGSTLTTYASGRQVQQAPGKSAYVVKP